MRYKKKAELGAGLPLPCGFVGILVQLVASTTAAIRTSAVRGPAVDRPFGAFLFCPAVGARGFVVLRVCANEIAQAADAWIGEVTLDTDPLEKAWDIVLAK